MNFPNSNIVVVTHEIGKPMLLNMDNVCTIIDLPKSGSQIILRAQSTGPDGNVGSLMMNIKDSASEVYEKATGRRYIHVEPEPEPLIKRSSLLIDPKGNTSA